MVFLLSQIDKVQSVHNIQILLINVAYMEISVTEFRKNMSKYFDVAYFKKEPITLKRRGYKLKLMYEWEDCLDTGYLKSIETSLPEWNNEENLYSISDIK